MIEYILIIVFGWTSGTNIPNVGHSQVIKGLTKDSCEAMETQLKKKDEVIDAYCFQYEGKQ